MPVFCGLASARQRLAVAVVDDAGRLLAARELTDDATGYAELCSILADRSEDGRCWVPVATDNDTSLISLLFAAAGRPVAFAETESVEGFISDDPPGAPVVARRAVGLARALQVGEIGAGPQPAPRDLAGLRSLLVAHAALLIGRKATAAALRQVLRELYPAALRAFGDPATGTPLAILEALPDPGMVRSGAAEVAARLTEAGHADAGAALAALRSAVADSEPGRLPSEAVATSVRHAVAAIQSGDAAAGALLDELRERVEPRAGPRPLTKPPVSPPAPVPTAPPAQRAVAGATPVAPPHGPTTRPAQEQRPAAGVRPAGRRRSAPTFPARVTPLAPRPFGPLPPADHPAAEHPAPPPPPADHQPTEPPPPPLAPPVVPPPMRPPEQRRPLEPVRPTVPPHQSDLELSMLTPDELPTDPRLDERRPPLVETPTNGRASRLTEIPVRGARRDYDPLNAPVPPEPDDGGLSDSGLSDSAMTDSAMTDTAMSLADAELPIFAATRSAWFQQHDPKVPQTDWATAADSGWRAAEAASSPAVSGRTSSGLPRRVPKANLVPGSAVLARELPKLIIRDAAGLAANTVAYFRGWNRARAGVQQ